MIPLLPLHCLFYPQLCHEPCPTCPSASRGCTAGTKEMSLTDGQPRSPPQPVSLDLHIEIMCIYRTKRYLLIVCVSPKHLQHAVNAMDLVLRRPRAHDPRPSPSVAMCVLWYCKRGGVHRIRSTCSMCAPHVVGTVRALERVMNVACAHSFIHCLILLPCCARPAAGLFSSIPPPPLSPFSPTYTKYPAVRDEHHSSGVRPRNKTGNQGLFFLFPSLRQSGYRYAIQFMSHGKVVPTML